MCYSELQRFSTQLSPWNYLGSLWPSNRKVGSTTLDHQSTTSMSPAPHHCPNIPEYHPHHPVLQCFFPLHTVKLWEEPYSVFISDYMINECPRQSNLREEEVLSHLKALGFSPSFGGKSWEKLKQQVTSIHSHRQREKNGPKVPRFLPSSTVQWPLPVKWCFPKWTRSIHNQHNPPQTCLHAKLT